MRIESTRAPILLMPFRAHIRCLVQHGPEAVELHKTRHDHALYLISAREPEPAQPFFRAIFWLHIGGSLQQDPFLFGLQKCRVYGKRNVAYIDIGIPGEMLTWDDGRYRNKLCEFILEGGEVLAKRLKKRKLEVDADLSLQLVKDILEEYLQLPLPLPPIPREAEQIRETREVIRSIEEGKGLPFEVSGAVSFFIYFPNAMNASRFKAFAAEKGYQCRISPRGKNWLCLARTVIQDSAHLQRESNLLNSAAQRFGGEFDGWESNLDP